jgi:enoyl-CoA hydratase
MVPPVQTDDPVRIELGRVTTLTLNRPDKHNAMTAEMGRALAEAVRAVNADEAVRLVLIRGEGRAFSAGGDFSLIEENSRRSKEENRAAMPLFYRSFLSVLEIRVPTLAVIHGAAVGAGLCLALACDLRFAAERAKLGANFVRVGLHPGMGCSLLLPRLVGPARAAELILSGRLVSGEEAAAIGLVNRAVPSEELENRIALIQAEILAAAPVAVRQAKATLVAPVLRALDEALAREAECQAEGFATADLREAITAFREGRAPVFHGV